MKFRVHAAKIPEGIQNREKRVRMLAGDLVYVNACDDKPWSRPPEGMEMLEGEPCPACTYIVAVNREKRTETRASG